MRYAVVVLLAAGVAVAQQGQEGPKAGWPCVPGRAVDPAYLETSESTGGQLFLFQKNEIALSGPALSASYTHPATILRAVGQLSGARDFEFPVDSTVSSMLVLVSLQCRSSIRLLRPSGIEMTQANSALSTDLQAGRIVRVDGPETGKWQLQIVGTGLFVLSVLGKSDLRLADVELTAPQKVNVRLSGEVSDLRVAMVDASGTALSEARDIETTSPGNFAAVVAPQIGRFRIAVTGTDREAVPFQRMYPVLFRAAPAAGPAR